MDKRKHLIIEKLNSLLDQRIETAVKSIKATRESRDGENKSSMGDKYETGRIMAQMEMHKLNDQLEQSFKLKKALAQISVEKICDTADFGSLVTTNLGFYFISVGLGLVEIKDEKCFCISMASPIGQALQGKKVGDKINFQNKVIEIVEVC